MSVIDRYRCKKCGVISFVKDHGLALFKCNHDWQRCWEVIGPIPSGSAFTWDEAEA